MNILARSVLAAAAVAALAFHRRRPGPAATLGPLKTMTRADRHRERADDDFDFAVSVAIERGIFKQYNLELSLITESGDTQACQSTFSGSTDISECTTNTQLAANTKGADLIQFDGELRLPIPYQLVSAPSITDWSQLKGKTILLSNEKSMPTYFFEMMARAHGMNKSDFQFAYGIGTSVGRLAALKSGAAQATLIGVPASLKVEAEGYHILESTFTTPSLAPDKFAGGGMMTTRRWAEKHADVLVAYISAVRDAVKWLYDPANKAEVLALMTKTYKLDTPALTEQVYAIAIGRSLQRRPLHAAGRVCRCDQGRGRRRRGSARRLSAGQVCAQHLRRTANRRRCR